MCDRVLDEGDVTVPVGQAWRAALTLCAAGVLTLSLSGGAAAEPAASAAPSPVFAAYVDTSLSGEFNFVGHAITSQHLHDITAGFVIARPHSCIPDWGDFQPVANDPGVSKFIKTARADGADVIVSFGGQIDPATGGEIATTCASTTKLTAAYRKVIKELHATHIDFDVEGAALGKPGSIKRRFAAIHALEASDPKLVVSLTIPVTPTGLDAPDIGLLKAAKHARARLDLLNLMAMDYGGKREMGTTAIAVAKHALRQLRRFSAHATYRNIGITPMVGQNDSAHEVFTLADAHRVVGFAQAHHVGRLAFWSLDRDQQCGSATTAATFDCSGIAQTSLKFTQIFAS